MAWSVRLPDGTLTEPFKDRSEADAYADTYNRLPAPDTGPVALPPLADSFTPAAVEEDNRTAGEVYDQAPHPAVTRAVFMRRLSMGWSPERAVNTTPDGRYLSSVHKRHRGVAEKLAEQMGAHNAGVHEVEGRRRTLHQWAASCQLPIDTLRKGAARHGSLAAYFEHIGWHPSKPATPGDPEISDDRWTPGTGN